MLSAERFFDQTPISKSKTRRVSQVLNSSRYARISSLRNGHIGAAVLQLIFRNFVSASIARTMAVQDAGCAGCHKTSAVYLAKV